MPSLHPILQKLPYAWFVLTALAASRLIAMPTGPEHPTMPISSADNSSPLFVTRRDDRSPDHLTKVSVDAGRTARTPVSPFLFGNFIEHLGGAVYEAIWANALLNPNLERIEPNDVAPPAWSLQGRAVWIEGGDASPRCIQLQPPIEKSASGALWQSIQLPLQRTRSYTATLSARGDGRLLISLNVPESGRDVAKAEIQVAGREWRSFRLPLHVLPNKTPHALRFTIAWQGGGPIEVDQIRLFPDDAVHGVDPDLLKRAEALHIPVLRWPGGNFASGYHWRDGIGPENQRPTRRNPAWGGVEPNSFGTEEFLRFCRRVGAQPQLTVNAGDGAPEEAAAWVRYCNAPADDPIGRLRAANGAVKPHAVEIWEVGNELYGGWQIGHTDPAGNAARFVRFRDAMLQADPHLKLIATGKGEEFTPDGLARDREWNRALLQTSLQNGGRPPDYLSIHPLVWLPGITGGGDYTAQYESALAHPTFMDQRLLPDLADLIHTTLGPNAPTRLALTEWGIIVGGPDWRNGPNHDALAGALYNALTLNVMLRHSDIVGLANMTALTHGGGVKRWNGQVYVDPQYYTQLLYTAARPYTPVATTTVGPGHDVPARGQMPAVSDVLDIDVAATLTQDGRQLTIFAVNRSLNEARPLQLEVSRFQVAAVKATILTAPHPQDGSGWDHVDAVRPRPFDLPAWPHNAATPWRIVLPPHSLIVLTLHGDHEESRR